MFRCPPHSPPPAAASQPQFVLFNIKLSIKHLSLPLVAAVAVVAGACVTTNIDSQTSVLFALCWRLTSGLCLVCLPCGARGGAGAVSTAPTVPAVPTVQLFRLSWLS